MLFRQFGHLLLLLLLTTFLVPTDALSAAEQQTVLDRHNTLRSGLAKGAERNSNNVPMPSAINMARLAYDTGLEGIAQAWANQCTMAHSHRTGVGENLFMTTDPSIANSQVLQQACNSWWGELGQFGIQPSLVLTMDQFNRGIGHWSQMAWAATLHVGCAVARCPNSVWKTYVVCNYSPPGNYLNEPVYQQGPTCTGCSQRGSQWKCDASGLCTVS